MTSVDFLLSCERKKRSSPVSVKHSGRRNFYSQASLISQPINQSRSPPLVQPSRTRSSGTHQASEHLSPPLLALNPGRRSSFATEEEGTLGRSYLLCPSEIGMRPSPQSKLQSLHRPGRTNSRTCRVPRRHSHHLRQLPAGRLPVSRRLGLLLRSIPPWGLKLSPTAVQGFLR